MKRWIIIIVVLFVTAYCTSAIQSQEFVINEEYAWDDSDHLFPLLDMDYEKWIGMGWGTQEARVTYIRKGEDLEWELLSSSHPSIESDFTFIENFYDLRVVPFGDVNVENFSEIMELPAQDYFIWVMFSDELNNVFTLGISFLGSIDDQYWCYVEGFQFIDGEMIPRWYDYIVLYSGQVQIYLDEIDKMAETLIDV